MEEAIKEFELQGVDLGDIDKTYAGPDGRGEHPATIATKEYVVAVERDPMVLADVAAAGEALRRAAGGDAAVPGWAMAVANAGGVHAGMLAVTKCVASCATGGGDSSSLAGASLIDACKTLAAVLGCDEGRDTFALLKFPMAFIADVVPTCVSLGPQGVEAAAGVIAAASTKNEACKGAFVKASAEKPLVAVFREHTDGAALRAACAAVRALTTGTLPRSRRCLLRLCKHQTV